MVCGIQEALTLAGFDDSLYILHCVIGMDLDRMGPVCKQGQILVSAALNCTRPEANSEALPNL